MSEQIRRVGRPRQWTSEAERKRAYRARKGAELVDPIGQRAAAQEARREAAGQRSAAEDARREADRWRRKAATAEKRAEAAERRAVRESAAAQRFLAERNEARRLLRRKLQWAKHANDARLDAQELLALVAELYAELDKLRKQVSTLRPKGSSQARPRSDPMESSIAVQLPYTQGGGHGKDGEDRAASRA